MGRNHAPPLRVHTPHPPLAPRAFTPARGPKVTSFASSMLSAALACHRARATTPLRRLPSSRSSRRHPHRDTAKDWRRRPRQWSPFCLVAVLESCTPQVAMSTIGTGLSRGDEGGRGPTAPARPPPAGPSPCCPPGPPARSELPSAKLVHCKALVNTGWGSGVPARDTRWQG